MIYIFHVDYPKLCSSGCLVQLCRLSQAILEDMRTMSSITIPGYGDLQHVSVKLCYLFIICLPPGFLPMIILGILNTKIYLVLARPKKSMLKPNNLDAKGRYNYQHHALDVDLKNNFNIDLLLLLQQQQKVCFKFSLPYISAQECCITRIYLICQSQAEI